MQQKISHQCPSPITIPVVHVKSYKAGAAYDDVRKY